MKKQKFNGKLRLKKSVISNLNAMKVQGGNTELAACWSINTCPNDMNCISEACGTLFGQVTCGVACNITADPGCVSGTPDCNTIHVNTDCACL